MAFSNTGMGQEEPSQQQQQQRQSKVEVALELAKQTVNFGVYLNLKATWEASLALPWGLAAAGAAATRTFVDAGDVQGVLVPVFVIIAALAIVSAEVACVEK
jgi:hypothetical protein